MPAHYCASVHATAGVCVCAVLTLFFVLFCSAKQAEIHVQPPPPPDDGLPFVVWYNQPNEGDEAFMASFSKVTKDHKEMRQTITQLEALKKKIKDQQREQNPPDEFALRNKKKKK